MSRFTIEAIQERAGHNDAHRREHGLPTPASDIFHLLVTIRELERMVRPTEDLNNAQAKLAMTGTEPGIRGGRET